MGIIELILFLICVALTLFLIVACYAIISTKPLAQIECLPGEESFVDPIKGN